MESAYAAALQALKMAEDCRNVAKISNVASPFGEGTICILAPGQDDVVVFDKHEVPMGKFKAKVGLPNRRLLAWSYKLDEENHAFRLQRIPLVTGRARARIATSEELPTPAGIYEWEAHGLLQAMLVKERSTANFSVIGLVTDNLGSGEYVQNQSREDCKEGLKKFLKRVFEEDGFFFTSSE